MTASEVGSGAWDAIVIGAGPAGALSAMLLGRAGCATLLVERETFPREKVCGGCLNLRALGVLRRSEVLAEVEAAGARRLSRIELHCAGRTATLALPAGLAISRSLLDASLVRAAVASGVCFLPETAAAVRSGVSGGHRCVKLRGRRQGEVVASARIVVVADGLAHASLRECPEFHGRIAATSRLGLGAVLPAGTLHVPDGSIVMGVGRSGYVGLVTAEDGRTNVAAAVAAGFLKHEGRAGAALAALAREAGIRCAARSLEDADWHGTVPLTRALSRVAGERLFVLGDSAGYVEPFTGEGMAWALEAAEALSPLATSAIMRWDPALASAWTEAHRRIVSGPQRRCHALARVLRHPWLVGIALAVLRRRPSLARPVVAHLGSRAPAA